MASITSWIPWYGDGATRMEVAWRWVRVLGSIYLVGCTVFVWKQCGGFGKPLPELIVPSVIGQTRTEAVRRLQDQGFEVHVDQGDRSDGYRTGQVMQQSMPAGMRVRKGRSIYLLVCQGPLHVNIPDLHLAPSDSALKALIKLGLNPTTSNLDSDSVPFDEVIEQAPSPGTRVEVGSPVALVVSDGPPDDWEWGGSGDSAPSSRPVRSRGHRVNSNSELTPDDSSEAGSSSKPDNSDPGTGASLSHKSSPGAAANSDGTVSLPSPGETASANPPSEPDNKDSLPPVNLGGGDSSENPGRLPDSSTSPGKGKSAQEIKIPVSPVTVERGAGKTGESGDENATAIPLSPASQDGGSMGQ